MGSGRNYQPLKEAKMHQHRRSTAAARRSARIPRALPLIAFALTLAPTLALVLTVVTLLLVATPGRSAAQGPDMPLQFKIVGEFHDPQQDKDAGGVNAFTVNILKKTWILDIDNSYTQQGAVLGSSVLKQIYPPILTFTGPKELTDQLTDPAIAGKTYTLTGQLYIKQRLFRLNTVEGPKSEEESKGDAGSGPTSDADAKGAAAP